MARIDEGKSWRWSKHLAVSWELITSGGQFGDFDKLSDRFIEVVNQVLTPLENFDEIQRMSLYAAVPGQNPNQNGLFTEEARYSMVGEEISNMGDVMSTLKQLKAENSNYFFEDLYFTLNTWILEDDQLIKIPQTASLSIRANEYLKSTPVVGEEITIHILYRTNIDIWFEKVTESFDYVRDNTEPARQNYPRLETFLKQVEKNLGVPFEIIEIGSQEFWDYLQSKGWPASKDFSIR